MMLCHSQNSDGSEVHVSSNQNITSAIKRRFYSDDFFHPISPSLPSDSLFTNHSPSHLLSSISGLHSVPQLKFHCSSQLSPFFLFDNVLSDYTPPPTHSIESPPSSLSNSDSDESDVSIDTCSQKMTEIRVCPASPTDFSSTSSLRMSSECLCPLFADSIESTDVTDSTECSTSSTEGFASSSDSIAALFDHSPRIQPGPVMICSGPLESATVHSCPSDALIHSTIDDFLSPSGSLQDPPSDDKTRACLSESVSSVGSVSSVCEYDASALTTCSSQSQQDSHSLLYSQAYIDDLIECEILRNGGQVARNLVIAFESLECKPLKLTEE
ncbi:hypothetical protein ADUPG1_000040 [Aduncisulcus paluster]|uniref:Uncharacterized protein n=1 Tax=Aduncisulcus paluster TaxID=2918883 RepID=A0ABQ5K4D5_9EUKA|nr:hypothetical protein ADUPG1_000040 [Aduncisulcus paluster]|eukprot:gnl/Carplike_NY0171/3520_a4752_335.p1 GENE.gnl/Carplike_NY0171/3520_a4752_335~~gnl/Carplike_NY0171/3520_a4752_335.p1  ORF type:complete len:327 (-),score=71.29 gnl/Carplike_NY0171/3520_a4752_335:953-1933(-)